jgi:hypothetical protein
MPRPQRHRGDVLAAHGIDIIIHQGDEIGRGLCIGHYPGGSRGCACRLLPTRVAFPKWPEGRIRA